VPVIGSLDLWRERQRSKDPMTGTCSKKIQQSSNRHRSNVHSLARCAVAIYVKNNNDFEQTEPIVRECPHCGVHAPMVPIATPGFAALKAARPHHTGVAFRCAACNEPRFARAAIRSYGDDRIILSANLVEVERPLGAGVRGPLDLAPADRRGGAAQARPPMGAALPHLARRALVDDHVRHAPLDRRVGAGAPPPGADGVARARGAARTRWS